MSSTGGQPTHLPVDPVQLELRGYHLALAFHPQIRLERKKGFEFAVALSDYIDPSSVVAEAHQWRLSQPISGSPNSRLNIIVEQRQLQIGAAFPGLSKEWLEERFSSVVREFREVFKPESILSSAAMVRAVLQVDGDAREFLARHVMKLAPERIDPFGRPIHLVGLRFFFPPFAVKRKGKDESSVTPWQVDVKAESLIEDPSKLFLEADGRWPQLMQWSDDGEQQVIQRLEIVSDYLKKNVVSFLRTPENGGMEGR